MYRLNYFVVFVFRMMLEILRRFCKVKGISALRERDSLVWRGVSIILLAAYSMTVFRSLS